MTAQPVHLLDHGSRGARTSAAGSWLLPAVLSTTAGAVDIIGFLSLGGLLTAHITGNVVVVAAHYVTGGFGQAGPLLAVPVFIAVLGTLALAFGTVGRVSDSPRRSLLVLHAALLAACLSLGVRFGPFADADRPIAVLVGMLAVSAMATQNALVKLALQACPLDRSDDHEHHPADHRPDDTRLEASGPRRPRHRAAPGRGDVRVHRGVRGGLCDRGPARNACRALVPGVASRPRRGRRPAGRTAT